MGATEESLNRITASAGVAWDLRWGLVFVATEERLADLARSDGRPTDFDALENWETNAYGYLNAGLSFRFENVPLPRAMRAALRGTPFELHVPEALRGTLNEIRVTLGSRALKKRQILTALLVPRGYAFDVTEAGVRIR